MVTDQSSKSKRTRTALFIGGALVAIAVVVYFSFFYPPESEKNLQGTIGGVKKYHSSQIESKDVQVGNESATQTSTDAQGNVPETVEGKTEAAKTEAAKTEAAKTEAAKTEAAKTEAAKTAAAKTEAAKTEAAKTQAAKTEAAKTQAAKAEAAKTEAAKTEAAKTEAGKNDRGR
jgi:hypothetical protein